MKTFILGLLVLSNAAMARDSQWSLCRTTTTIFEESETLLLNRYEHRSANGAGRATDLTLIFGGHTLLGSFNSTEVEAGALKLSSKTSSFKGNVQLSDEAVELKGILNLNGAATALDAKFSCEILRD